MRVRERVMGAFLGGLSKDIWRTLSRQYLNRCDNAMLRQAIIGDVARAADIAESAVEGHYDNLLFHRKGPLSEYMKASAELSDKEKFILVLAAVRTRDFKFTNVISCTCEYWWYSKFNNVVHQRRVAVEVARMHNDGEFLAFAQHLPAFPLLSTLVLEKGPNYLKRFFHYKLTEKRERNIDLTISTLILGNCVNELEKCWDDDYSISALFTGEHVNENYAPFDCQQALEWVRAKTRIDCLLYYILAYTTRNTWEWVWSRYPLARSRSHRLIRYVRSMYYMEYFHLRNGPMIPFDTETCYALLYFRWIHVANKDELRAVMDMHGTNPVHMDQLSDIIAQVQASEDTFRPALVERFRDLLVSKP